MNKDERLVMLITKEQKDKIKAESKKQNINEPEYVRQAIEFYSTFDVHFLEHIYALGEKTKLPMPLVIQQLLASYLAQDDAYMDKFKKPSKAFQRAFQYDENGLIQGNAHSDLVFEQTKEDIEKFKGYLIETNEAGKPMWIPKEQMPIFKEMVDNFVQKKEEARAE
jgi:hypothetical protein